MIKKIGFVILLLFISVFSYMKITNKNINDIGLSLFAFVKKIKGEEVDTASLGKANSIPISHTTWNTLTAKNVTANGKVNYKGFIDDKILLDEYLSLLSENPPSKNWSEEEQLAYWINAYNAFTVKLIVDHYPVKTIKQLGGAVTMVNSTWDIKFFKIGGIDFDLNTIEHQILRKNYEEPRIHFAINCASFSCPRLRNEAFEATQLETQLEDQAKQFINNSDKNIITSEGMKLSKIFDWFKSDFVKKETLISFLQKYTEVELSESMEIEYLDYGWDLNE